MKWIIQFVLKQFAQQSAKKTGIAKLLKENDPIVQMGVKKIEQTLKNIGINPRNLTSTDDVLKSLNYHKAMMDQKLKQEFKGLGLGKGIKSLEKKSTTKKLPEWTEGWTPKIVPKETEAQIKARMVKKNKETVEKIKQRRHEEAVEAEKRKMAEDPDYIPDIIDPEDFASGGIARVGMFVGGTIVKGGKWMIKNLLDIRQKIKKMTLAPHQMKNALDQIDDHIRNIKAGGPIPEEAIQTIRKDPKFRSVHQTRSTDPDMFEMEQVVLDYGKKHAEGGVAGQLHLNDGGRVSFTKGGKVSSGLAHVLGV